MGLKLEEIEALIAKEQVVKVGTKTCVVVLTLVNGFEVIGSSACVNPAEYDETIGAKYARQRALDKVWEVAGYKAQADKYEQDQIDKMPF